MNRNATFLFLFFILTTDVPALTQPWSYDFGTGTGTYNANNSSSETFLPNPPAGTDRVRRGSQGGAFVLANPGLAALGSGTELQINASTGGSVNKFSVYNYPSGVTFSTEFTLRLGNSSGGSTATSGEWYFFQGDGGDFSSNGFFTGDEIFSGLRFTFNIDATISVDYRDVATWTSLGAIGITQGSDFELEIYGNNSTSSASYAGGTQSVAANTWDLWVNRTLVGDDLPKSELADNTPIGSWMFIGRNSTSNQAYLFLDNFNYSNDLSKALLPVTIDRFSAVQHGKAVLVSWATASEQNNDYFSIERSNDGQSFKEIGTVSGAGNSDIPLQYRYEDNQPEYGLNYYRLRQVDFDGKATYHKVVAVDFRPRSTVLTLFPTLVHNELTIELPQPSEHPGQVSAFNLWGQAMGHFTLPAGQRQLTLPLDHFQAGSYILKVKVGEETISAYFVKQ